MTPTPASFEALAKHLYKRHEARLSRERREHLLVRDRSMVEDAELRGGLQVQHQTTVLRRPTRDRPAARRSARRIASELRAEGRREPAGRARHRGASRPARALQPPRTARRGQPAAVVSQGRVRLDRARADLAAAVRRLPDGPVRSQRLCRWRRRRPRSCGRRTAAGRCAMRSGAVSIHVELRKQNTAVPGTVEQGKSSYLVATVAEDLAPRAMRGDRARPQGRCRRGGDQRGPERADVHAARPRSPDMRLQPTGGGCARRRDRRLRRRGAEEPVHRCQCHIAFDDRKAQARRLHPRLEGRRTDRRELHLAGRSARADRVLGAGARDDADLARARAGRERRHDEPPHLRRDHGSACAR